MGGSAVFVGRDRELSRLRAVVGGEARLLLVMGDAGVGKTRLVTEGMRRVAADGVVAVWGGCLPMRETLPLLPVADALGELSRVDGGELLEAALAVSPRYVRGEVERLLPQLGDGAVESSGRVERGQRDRLFAAIAELLGAVAQRRRLVLVVEDVHWADAATLDCLTFLTRARRDPALRVVVTCRSDEAPLEPQVADWLAQVRGRGGVAEVRLGPLSREETAEQVAELAGSPASALVVDELYARAEGNPFFTEQLVAAASPEGVLGSGVGLPARLAELLVARAGRCGGAARTVLSALAVAGRPLGEDLLGAVSGLDLDGVRGGLHELTAARLLADGSVRGEQRPRHALLAEAVAADLLPGERAAFHERVAGALQAAGDDTSAAEVAGHWAAAGRAAEELPARVRAAEAAERVFGYAEAARHWQRAIELFAAAARRRATDRHRPAPAVPARPRRAPGSRARASVAACSPRRRTAASPTIPTRPSPRRYTCAPRGPDGTGRRPTRARCSSRRCACSSRCHRRSTMPRPGSPTPSSCSTSRASEDARRAALTRGWRSPRRPAPPASPPASRSTSRTTRACAARSPRVSPSSSGRGRWPKRPGTARRCWRSRGDESDLLLKTGRFDEAAEAGLRGVQAARESGRHTSFDASIAAANAAEAMLARGRTAEAAELIDPLTDAPPDPDHYSVHGLRAEIDLLRGDVDGRRRAAAADQVVVGRISSIDDAGEIAQRAAEVAVWAGRPADGLAEVREALARYQATDWTIHCGWLLVVGMRACADLAEQGRARRDESATRAALAAADDLVAWVDRMGGAPFTDHPYVATIPAARASWDAERSRLSGPSDPAAWQAAADAWAELGCPHRAAYAGWRHAEARLLAGEPPAAVADTVRSAAAAAAGHAPLLAAIHALAERAHIPLDTRRARRRAAVDRGGRRRMG